VCESTNVNSIQQSRAEKNAVVLLKAFNVRRFSRPVPLHIRMAHHFFPGASPITGYPHEGLDYSGVGNQRASDIEGQPIHAITSGNVAFVLDACVPSASTRMCGDGWGNQVIIDHGGNVFSRYAHIQKGSITVKVGDAVKTGEKFAKIGMTGYTLGPHLHLELGTMSPNSRVNACAPSKFAQVFNPWLNLEAVDSTAPTELDDAPSAAASTTPPASAQSCIVSDSDGYTHLRGADGAVIASIKKNNRLSVSSTSGSTRSVSVEGWVSSTFTSCKNAPICGAQVTIADSAPATLGEATGTNLRADAATTSALVGVVKNGTKASVLHRNGDRLRIRLAGTVSSSRCTN